MAAVGGSISGWHSANGAGSACRCSSSAATSAWCCGRFRPRLARRWGAACRRPACAITRPRGLFLVTGPTGSGKSTAAGEHDRLSSTTRLDHHIITIEDPIEFYHMHKKVDRQPARSGRGRAQFCRRPLRRALRQDPDVILVGEIATWRRSKPPSPPPKPATSSLARCTPPAPRARSTASSTSFRPTAGTDSRAAFDWRSSGCCRRR